MYSVCVYIKRVCVFVWVCVCVCMYVCACVSIMCVDLLVYNMWVASGDWPVLMSAKMSFPLRMSYPQWCVCVCVCVCLCTMCVRVCVRLGVCLLAYGDQPVLMSAKISFPLRMSSSVKQRRSSHTHVSPHPSDGLISSNSDLSATPGATTK
jgi:hypothetical protein